VTSVSPRPRIMVSSSVCGAQILRAERSRVLPDVPQPENCCH
jgi:hypothetical protein